MRKSKNRSKKGNKTHQRGKGCYDIIVDNLNNLLYSILFIQ